MGGGGRGPGAAGSGGWGPMPAGDRWTRRSRRAQGGGAGRLRHPTHDAGWCHPRSGGIPCSPPDPITTPPDPITTPHDAVRSLHVASCPSNDSRLLAAPPLSLPPLAAPLAGLPRPANNAANQCGKAIRTRHKDGEEGLPTSLRPPTWCALASPPPHRPPPSLPGLRLPRLQLPALKPSLARIACGGGGVLGEARRVPWADPPRRPLARASTPSACCSPR